MSPNPPHFFPLYSAPCASAASSINIRLCLREISRIGSIESGNTVSDYNEDEIERQISINTSLLHGEWEQHKINIIDPPGYSDFFGEVVGAFRAVDSVLVVVSASSGV